MGVPQTAWGEHSIVRMISSWAAPIFPSWKPPYTSWKDMNHWLVVWLPWILDFPRNSGLLWSSQLTNSYFSEGFFPNHQPDQICCDEHLWRIHPVTVPPLGGQQNDRVWWRVKGLIYLRWGFSGPAGIFIKLWKARFVPRISRQLVEQPVFGTDLFFWDPRLATWLSSPASSTTHAITEILKDFKAYSKPFSLQFDFLGCNNLSLAHSFEAFQCFDNDFEPL